MLFVMTGVALQADTQRKSVGVSATVLPAARIEVLSSTSARISVTLNPNTQAVVWVTSGVCEDPRGGQMLSGSGVHQFTFPEQDAAGKTLCVTSTDGAVRAESRISFQ